MLNRILTILGLIAVVCAFVLCFVLVIVLSILVIPVIILQPIYWILTGDNMVNKYTDYIFDEKRFYAKFIPEDKPPYK